MSWNSFDLLAPENVYLEAREQIFLTERSGLTEAKATRSTRTTECIRFLLLCYPEQTLEKRRESRNGLEGIEAETVDAERRGKVKSQN